jgi:hypothetical protein
MTFRMTQKEYMKPNTAVRDGGPPVQWWTPPEKSKGLRHFKFTSKGNSRGAAVIDNVVVESESGQERTGTLVVRARSDTLRVVEQTPQIDYVDARGQVRQHTFDLKVFKTNGLTSAIDFKPPELVKKLGIRELHALVAPQMSPRDADEVLLLTPRMYSSVDKHNAKLMHAMARQEYPDDDEKVRRLIARMKGPAEIADLVGKSRIAAYGFGAVVRAIAAGRLRVTEDRKIDYDVTVEPVHEAG